MGPGARGGSREAMKCHDGSEKCGARLYCVLVERSGITAIQSAMWGQVRGGLV